MPTTGKGIPPWHMWGNTQTFTVAQAGGFFLPSVQAGGQLLKVSYGRPETWQWVFAAKLLSGPTAGDAPQVGQVQVAFNLTIGIGRSNLIIPFFERFAWSWQLGSQAPTSIMHWTTSVQGTRSFPNNAEINPPDVVKVDQIVSQDIQLEAIVTNSSITSDNLPAVVEVTAMFAPRHHFRPEWFMDHFPGGEHRGA